MKCAYCGEPCKGYAAVTPAGSDTTLYFHHGDSEWDDDPNEPSCYEKWQWFTDEEDSLLDFILRPKKEVP